MQKKYPRRAVRRGQQGTVLIYLVVDRDGRLKEHGLRESSGHGVLDREALKLIERAQPLPAAPDDLDESTLELTVPVRFVLR